MADPGRRGALAFVLLIAAVLATAVKADLSSIMSSEDIQNVCEKTNYSDICKRTLDKVSHTSSPSEFLKVAFQAAMDEVHRGNALSTNMSQFANDAYNKDALKGCEQLMLDAAEELRAALITVHNLDQLRQRTFDIKVWLTAVMSYQQTCIEEITQSDLQEDIKNGLRMIAMVTSNAIAILNDLQHVISLMHNVNFTSRRLMSDDEGGKYPSWFSSGDRRLLASTAVTPNVVVAPDGSGDFKTVTDAVNAVPPKNLKRFIIHVKAGVYKEIVTVSKTMFNVYMYGDGANVSVITGSLNFIDGVKTSATATFVVEGQGFICKDMGFSNTAGPEKHQAVALRVRGDMSIFYKCRIDAYQDTLYVQAKRQLYRDCVVSGTVDFIFGDGLTMIQNSLLIPRRPMDKQQNLLTAQNRNESTGISGIIIQNCKIVAEDKLYPVRKQIKSYLGRPWNDYARTVVMETVIGDVIDPTGWSPWSHEEHRINTVYYAEYNNRGPGAGTSARVTWPGYHIINRKTAEAFTADRFFDGKLWIPYSGVPYDAGFTLA